jgi:hypothetical protein
VYLQGLVRDVVAAVNAHLNAAAGFLAKDLAIAVFGFALRYQKIGWIANRIFEAGIRVGPIFVLRTCENGLTIGDSQSQAQTHEADEILHFKSPPARVTPRIRRASASSPSWPSSPEFINQLHFSLKKLVHQFANVLAILLRKILKLFLKFRVEIYRQPQLRALTVKLSSYASGKIVITLHDYFLLYCLASFLFALRAEIKRIRALDSVSARNV